MPQSSIEPLEPRIAPATLTASMSGGTLKISALAALTPVDAVIVQTGPNSFTVSDDLGPAVPFNAVTALQLNLSDSADSVGVIFQGTKFKGATKILGGLGADLITLAGTGVSSGNIGIDFDGAASVNVNSDVRLTGALSVNGEGGFLGIAGQVGALNVDGIANVLTSTGSVIQSAKVNAFTTGLNAHLVGTIFGPLTINGDLGGENITLAGRIDGKVNLSLKDGGSLVNSTAIMGSSFTFRGGAQNDTVNLQADSAPIFPAVTGISGNVSISLGEGANSVQLNGGGGFFGGAIRILGGTGTDLITTTSGVFVGGAFTANLGAGANSVNSTGGYFMGNFSYAGLADNDTLTFGMSTSVRGKLALSLGDGTNLANIAPGLIGGGVRVTGGDGNDTVFFGGMSLDGPVSFNMKDGSNDVDFIGCTIRNGVTYTGGNIGIDDMRFDDTNVSGTVMMRGGNGSNILVLEVSGSLSKLTFLGGSDFDAVDLRPGIDTNGPFLIANIMLGDGSDLASINTVSYVDLNIDGGTGIDTLNRSAAALAAGFDSKNFETFGVI